MLKVQVTGLPGAGKTTGITAFLSKYEENGISYLDIRDFDPPNTAGQLAKTIKASKSPLVAESALGTNIKDTYVIRLEPPIQRIYHQLRQRGDLVDANYLSLLSSFMVYPDCIIRNPEELPEILANLFVQ